MEYEEASFQILLYAGNANSGFEHAAELIEEGKYDEASSAIVLGEAEILKAHAAHSELLSALAAGESVSCNILLAHAMDHMMHAENMCFFAKRLFKLYKELELLKSNLGGKEG